MNTTRKTKSIVGLQTLETAKAHTNNFSKPLAISRNIRTLKRLPLGVPLPKNELTFLLLHPIECQYNEGQGSVKLVSKVRQ